MIFHKNKIFISTFMVLTKRILCIFKNYFLKKATWDKFISSNESNWYRNKSIKEYLAYSKNTF